MKSTQALTNVHTQSRKDQMQTNMIDMKILFFFFFSKLKPTQRTTTTAKLRKRDQKQQKKVNKAKSQPELQVTNQKETEKTVWINLERQLTNLERTTSQTTNQGQQSFQSQNPKP